MSIQKRFSDQELEKIKQAVREAEKQISGEIVPVFVERSGYYTIANHRAAMLGACLVFALVVIFDRYVPAWAVYDPLLIFLLCLLAGLLASFIIHYIEPIKRFFLNQSHLNEATRKRAENAFLQEEVFNTRHRTGIMIFVSFFEREVIIMADRGISKVVDQKEWDTMVRGITANIKVGKVTDGIVAAIIRSGEILLEKGFVKTADDINELRDDLRIE